MTKKERIAELERRVAQLEAEPRQYVFPTYPAVPAGYRCPQCGAWAWGYHACWVYNPNIWSGTGTSDATSLPANVTVLYGATA